MRGCTYWAFPDAELPPAGDVEPKGHESIIVLNPNREPAAIALTFFYTDRPPARAEVSVEAERVRCLRTDDADDMGSVNVREGEQYAVTVESSVPVVAQYGRLDVRQANLAFYTTPGYCE